VSAPTGSNQDQEERCGGAPSARLALVNAVRVRRSGACAWNINVREARQR